VFPSKKSQICRVSVSVSGIGAALFISIPALSIIEHVQMYQDDTAAPSNAAIAEMDKVASWISM
jgi:hypothetical protein